MKFTERFNEALKHCGLTQAEIARQLGLFKTVISKYKTGETYPSLETFYELCKVLDVSADYLLGLTDEYK